MQTIPLKHFTKVFIVESQKEEEIRNGVQEGKSLARAFSQSDIPHALMEVRNKQDLQNVFESIAQEVFHIKTTLGVITIHMSMHGNEDGIGLTSNEFISWYDLSEMLKVFMQKALYFTLEDNYGNHLKLCPITICFSTCEGLNAVKINEYTEEDVSLFQLVVGPKEKVSWDEAERAFTAFHLYTLNGPADGRKAIEHMNSVVNLTDVFQSKFGKGIKWQGEEG